MPNKQKKQAKEKTLDILESLYLAAKRIARLEGTYENGEDKDWSEWWDLRDAIMKAKYHLKENHRNPDPDVIHQLGKKDEPKV
jgi:hypothetical protein